MRITPTAVARHRNGIGGEPFYVVTFQWTAPDERQPRRMVATAGDKPGQCHVLDLDETAGGNIAFAAGNSWRGDEFEPALRRAIDDFETQQVVLFANRRHAQAPTA